jgi:hypothetical protein
MPCLPAARLLAVAIACGSCAPVAAQDPAPPSASEATTRGDRAGDGIDVGPLRVRPGLGLTVGYDDNLNLAPRGADASWLWTLSPGLRVEGGSERSRVRATLSAEATRHPSSPVDDYEDYGLEFAWIYNPRVRHQFTLDGGRRFGHDGRGTAAREGDLGLLQLDVDRFRRDDVGLRYRFGAPGARGRIELDARAGQVDYLNNRELTAFRDRDDAGLGAAFYWRVAPRTSVLVRGERQRYDYDFATLDSRETHWFVGAEYEASARSTASAMVGRASKRFDDPLRDDFSGASWRARWDWRPRSYSLFSLSTGGEADETNGFGDYILRRDVTLGWTHDWSARLRSNVDAGFAREAQRPTERTDHVRYAGIGADYALRRWLRAGASWRWYDRSSSVDAFEYDRNLVLFSLEANL